MAHARHQFGKFKPIFALLEKWLPNDYALIGGFACTRWSLFFGTATNGLKGKDIDFIGGSQAAGLVALEFCRNITSDVSINYWDDNPGSMTASILADLPFFSGAKAEFLQQVPNYTRNAALPPQGIVFKLPYGRLERINVVDPCTLFVSKLPAAIDERRQKRKEIRDIEHMRRLSSVIPDFLAWARREHGEGRIPRDPAIVAMRVLLCLDEAKRVPDEIMEFLPSVRSACQEAIDDYKKRVGKLPPSEYHDIPRPIDMYGAQYGDLGLNL